MAVLYTVGNINLQTVELVAKAIKESEPQIMIRRVVIFDSAESEKGRSCSERRGRGAVPWPCPDICSWQQVSSLYVLLWQMAQASKSAAAFAIRSAIFTPKGQRLSQL